MNQTATWDVPFRSSTRRPAVIHLAEREEKYERALCGQLREDRPLEPNAQGHFCVICLELHWRKHGEEWRS